MVPGKVLSEIPNPLTLENLTSLVELLDKCTTCKGNPDEEYSGISQCRKGIFKDSSGKQVQAMQDDMPFITGESYYPGTIRTSNCDVLVLEGSNHGSTVDESLHHDLVLIMDAQAESIYQSHNEGSFQHLFWDQQMCASKLHDSRQMRWNPQMIRWYLHLRLVSGRGYRLLRQSGVVRLPSECTLLDNTHYVTPSTGFQEGVPEQLVQQAKLDDLNEGEICCFDL